MLHTRGAEIPAREREGERETSGGSGERDDNSGGVGARDGEVGLSLVARSPIARRRASRAQCYDGQQADKSPLVLCRRPPPGRVSEGRKARVSVNRG